MNYLGFYSRTKLVCENTECSRDVTLWRLPQPQGCYMFLYVNVLRMHSETPQCDVSTKNRL